MTGRDEMDVRHTRKAFKNRITFAINGKNLLARSEHKREISDVDEDDSGQITAERLTKVS